MGQFIPGGWTIEQQEMLVTLIGQGFSYSQSAKQINEKYGTNYSRNAAIGRANRIGLVAPEREKKPRTPRVYKPKTRSGEHHTITRIIRANGNSNAMRIVALTEAKEQRLRCVEISCTVPFADVTGCRYSDSADAPFLFCNGDVKDGSSWCVPHYHLVYTPAAPPKPRYMPQAMERRA